jgi:hypothetical protein
MTLIALTTLILVTTLLPRYNKNELLKMEKLQFCSDFSTNFTVGKILWHIIWGLKRELSTKNQMRFDLIRFDYTRLERLCMGKFQTQKLKRAVV